MRTLPNMFRFVARKHRVLLVSAFILAAIASPLQAAPVRVEAGFLGGIFGGFSLDFVTGSAGVQIEEVRYDLRSPLYLDPTADAPGELESLPFNSISGAGAVGFAGASGIFDGSTSFTLFFNDFDPGEAYLYQVDVDKCSGNALCAFTFGSDFAGSTITVKFSGLGLVTTSFSDEFERLRFVPLAAGAAVEGEVPAVPEPQTMGLLGSGVAAFAIVWRRKRAA